MKNIEKKIEPFIFSKISSINDCKIEEKKINLTHNRFDLAFKLLYLNNIIEKKTNSFKNIYYDSHIKAFSLGSYKEPGNPKKDTIEKYHSNFNFLFYDIKSNGFNKEKSLIPLAKDGSILNGAHRASISINLNIPASVIHTDLEALDYSYNFFKKRGVPLQLLDTAALTFIENDSKCFLALIWPAAEGRTDSIEKILSRIVYKKNIVLNHLGAHNLLSQIYEKEGWLGKASQNYPGIRGKLLKCFPTFSNVRAYVFQANSLRQTINLKEEIRNIFKIGKHSIHITDTKEETLKISKLLFNENSLHFLNNAHPNKYINVEKKLMLFKNELTKRNLNIYNYALDSGIVLEVYGIRAAKDIDYLTTSEVFVTNKIDHHHNELIYHGISEERIINDPKFHFWHNDMKFVSLLQTHNMKKNRNNEKDIIDVKLIDLSNQSTNFNKTIANIEYSFLFYREKIKFKATNSIKFFLTKIGLYKKTRGLYRKYINN